MLPSGRNRHRELKSQPRIQHFIKLVKLLPRTNTGAIHLELYENILLEPGQHPPYTALSYEWGSERLSKAPIFVNGEPLHVRCNLYYCLRDLIKYHDMANQLLWVDSLCINQTDVRERNHQVQHMRGTYALADKVFAWIGPPTASSIQILEKLESLTHTYNADTQALLDTCSRSYWKRMWIIQEVCLAKNLYIVCGRNAARWRQWQKVLDWASDGIDFMTETPAGLLSTFRASFHRGLLDGSLVEHIVQFRDFGCTARHDRVYALLGLVPDSGVMEVDYSRSVEELLLAVLAGLERGPMLPPIKTLAEALGVSLDHFQLEMSMLLNLRRSNAFEKAALTTFLRSPFMCNLSRPHASGHGERLSLPVEFFRCLQADKVFRCGCLLCREAAFDGGSSAVQLLRSNCVITDNKDYPN